MDRHTEIARSTIDPDQEFMCLIWSETLFYTLLRGKLSVFYLNDAQAV